MKETAGEWLHRLRMHGWLLHGLYGLVALTGTAALAYLVMSPGPINATTWAAAPALSLPYRVTCEPRQAQGVADTADMHLILVSGYQQAQRLLEPLCREVRALGIELEAYWGLSDDDRRRLLKEGRPALVFGRAHLVQSKAVSSLQAYREIAAYPAYASTLIATTAVAPTRRGLSGKRIGLLRDASSRSGRLVPVAYLRSIGLDASDYVTVFAESHHALRELLASGEVDVIASYWAEADAHRYPDWVATTINASVEGARWYLRPDLWGTPFSCVFQRMLLNSATDNVNRYFRDVRVTANDCI